MHGFGHGWFMGGGWFFGLAIIIVIFLLDIKLLNKSTPENNSKSKSALEILKDRYATGEINEEEFLKGKNNLKD